MSIAHTEVGIGARLDGLPLSRFHWRMLGLIAAGMYFDSFDIYIAGAVLAALIHSGESTLSQNAMFVSMTFFGMMAGAWLSGVVGDRFGRRFSYQFNLAIYGLASIGSTFAPNIEWLIGLRFIMGLGLGAEIVVGYGTLSELIPLAWRGRFGTILNLIINTALFLSTFLGWLIVPHFGWRPLFAIAGCGAGVVWFLRKKMPESPRWLAARGRMDEAEALVSRIETECGVNPVAAVAAIEREPRRTVPPDEGRLSDLFSRHLLSRTIVAIVVLISLFLVNFAFVSWVPTFLVKQGHSISNSLGLTAVMFAGGPVGSLLAFLLAERIGRKWGIVLFSLICAVVGVAYAFATSSFAITALGFVMTALIYVLSSLSIASYVPELFPTQLRMRGSGLANSIGRGVSILVPYAVTMSFTKYGIAGVLALIVGALIVQALVVATLGIETRKRSLEDIAAEAGPLGTQHAEDGRPATATE